LWARLLSVRCPPDKIVYDHRLGLKICAETGEVLEENLIDDSQDWRAYSPQEHAERARASPIAYTKPGMGIGATIGSLKVTRTRWILSKPPPVPTIKFPERSSVKPGAGTSLLVDLSAKLGLPKWLTEEIARLYQIVSSRGLSRGRDLKLSIVALIQLGARMHNYPITQDELVSLAGYEPTLGVKREVNRLYRLYSRLLGINLKPMKPEDYVPMLSSKLGLNPEVVVKAIEVLRVAREKGLMSSGKDPIGYACASIYIASNSLGVRVRQFDLARVAWVTEVTVRNRIKDLQKALDKD
jgi:transcription initiation factor TFIIB